MKKRKREREGGVWPLEVEVESLELVTVVGSLSLEIGHRTSAQREQEEERKLGSVRVRL